MERKLEDLLVYAVPALILIVALVASYLLS
jgi:hypothetical protein